MPQVHTPKIAGKLSSRTDWKSMGQLPQALDPRPGYDAITAKMVKDNKRNLTRMTTPPVVCCSYKVRVVTVSILLLQSHVNRFFGGSSPLTCWLAQGYETLVNKLSEFSPIISPATSPRLGQDRALGLDCHRKRDHLRPPSNDGEGGVSRPGPTSPICPKSPTGLPFSCSASAGAARSCQDPRLSPRTPCWGVRRWRLPHPWP